MTDLQKAAHAVIERWSTPLWRDVGPTATIVYALKEALAAELAKPERSPLTRERVRTMMDENGYNSASAQERADFVNGIRHAEAAHGITGAPS